MEFSIARNLIGQMFSEDTGALAAYSESLVYFETLWGTFHQVSRIFFVQLFFQGPTFLKG